MTITPEPDGRISLRVLISANGGRTDCCDRIELIVNPEYVRQALTAPKIQRPDGARLVAELPTFPCHIGFTTRPAA
jgi:hypothetical protein